MNRTEILNAIRTLSETQGFYTRVYNKLIDGSAESETVLDELEAQDFKDIVDLIMYLEE